MSCDCPNIAVFKPQRQANGKRELDKMFSWSAADYDMIVNNIVSKFSGKNDTRPIHLHVPGAGFREAMLVPCGHCIGCRLEYSRQWATRCCLEALSHECNFFLTLTYADLHLPTAPRSLTIDNDTGEILRDGYSHPLDPPALTKFFKDLRRYYSYHYNLDNIRFFAVGEYGDKSQRPHYHAICFNLPIFDLKFYKRDFAGHPLYTSEILSNIWKNGYVVVAECCFDTCAYVARYVLKKQTGLNKQVYDYLNITPEFTRMSRRPGIARFYYDANMDTIYAADQITIVGAGKKALQCQPPKYFDDLYGLDHDMTGISDRRLYASQLRQVDKVSSSPLRPSSILQSEVDARNNVIIALKRTDL